MRLDDDLRQRTKEFASRIVRFYAALPRQRKEVEVLGHQLLRSGTSIAANVREASRARSDLEFCSKLEIALQEADESLLWIELLMEDCGIANEASSWLLREVNELIAIFVTIVSRTRQQMLKHRNAETLRSGYVFRSLSVWQPSGSAFQCWSFRISESQRLRISAFQCFSV